MKLPTLLLLFFCIICISTPVFTQTKAIQASSTFLFDTGTGAIAYGDSLYYIYFPAQKRAEQSQEWDWSLADKKWDPYFKWIDHQFDSNGNLTYILTQFGNDVIGWKNYARSTRVFDSNNLLVSWVFESWKSGAWDTTITYMATYNTEGKVLTEDEGDYFNSYSYDPQGELTEILTSYKSTGGWVPSTKTVYEYENNGQIEYVTNYTFVDTVWSEVQKLTRTYDGAGNLTQSLAQVWNNGAWGNLTLTDIFYDASGNNTDELTKNWNGTTWKDGTRTKYTYDADNDLVEIFSENAVGGVWRKYNKSRNYYTEYVPSSEPAAPSFQMFPNPASTQLILEGDGLNRITIYSQEGKLICTQTLQDMKVQTIPLPLSEGQYQVHVSDAKGGVSTKILQVFH